MSYIPHSQKEIKEMLNFLGILSLDELFLDIPKELILKKELNLPKPLSEWELISEVKKTASKNINLEDCASFLGAGLYRHFIPQVVSSLISRGEFYTAYTPYQAEISQGILQSIYEFQSLICMLLEMDVANASLYDGPASLVEGVILTLNFTKRAHILISKGVHPEYRKILKTYLAKRAEIIEIPLKDGVTDLNFIKNKLSADTAALIIQNPNFLGIIEEGEPLAEIAKTKGALFLVCINEAISLGLIKPPSTYGANLVVGEAQSLGLPISFGGPTLGFIAAEEKLLRLIPGRIVGETIDVEGKRGFVLTLQAREQHIRRGKAASNICTNEALCALACTIYLSLLGKQGLRKASELNFQKAHYLFEQISKLKSYFIPFKGIFFNEFAVSAPVNPLKINSYLREHRIIGGYNLSADYPEIKNGILFCVTEITQKEQMDHLIHLLGDFN